ncbi:succinylglutamate desuccinylase/aspartoacylase family protein [Haematobacter genomosp. 1]|uniref:Peptidase M14 n=1 Tax=Haematobacter genomosp. 1 TaxID=366618 RepID=A0A212A8B5_9RHOB|nr:succinylglutamate desuccinylase/aspartoacylase family protein [Haematobacter genomosp. 1]OWJ75982.1 peptidase M14 [Haematobacter genomosp. 1]
MMDTPQDGLKRRDLLKASIASVGSAAVLLAHAGPAAAQGVAPGTAAPTAGTVYTGGVLQGKKVVSALDVEDLEPGQTHRLYFQGAEMRTGQYWHASVIVAKGAKPGKRVVLTSGVHGDEMSSVHTVMSVMNQLDPAEMTGTVMAVTDISPPALLAMQRKWPNTSRSIDLVDMNRVWPGNENGSAPSRHAALIFHHLLMPNADAAIDFHTGTTGFEVSAFNIASMDVPEVRAMADLYPVGKIMDMPKEAYPTTLHNALLIAGIPAICPEIGAARVLDMPMIALFVEGTMNVLKHHRIVAGPMGRTGKDIPVFVTRGAVQVVASRGGFVEHLVRLDGRVEAGQKIALQRNSFGEVIAEYESGVTGVVAGLRTDVMAEPGDNLAFIMFDTPGVASDGAYQE